ncbi:hypothetical protein BV372_34165 [Nostoc sp. T09]|nr:hypothetical protein BV372_34165 [Nostoc sp. T09]
MLTKENRRFLFDLLNLSFSLRIFLVVVKRVKIKNLGVVFLSKKRFLICIEVSSFKKLKCNKHDFG